MRTGFLAALALAVAAVFASGASAEVITPEVVKPEVVTPHAVTAAPEPSTAPADAPSPEASPTADAAPETAASGEPEAGDAPAPSDPSSGNLPVGDGRTIMIPGPYPLNISVANYRNALTLVYAISGMFGPTTQQELFQRSINVVRNTNILLGGDGGEPRIEVGPNKEWVQEDGPKAPPAGTPGTFDAGSPEAPGGGGPAGKRTDEPEKSEE